MKMKRLCIVLFISLFSVSAFSQTFDLSRLRAGAGPFFTSYFNSVGLNFNGVYNLDDVWEGSLGITHVFPQDYINSTILDFDGHYIFYNANSDLNFYALGGIGFTFYRDTYNYPNPGPGYRPRHLNETWPGLNVGAGMNLKLNDFLNLAPEVRVTIANSAYARIGATVQYCF